MTEHEHPGTPTHGPEASDVGHKGAHGPNGGAAPPRSATFTAPPPGEVHVSTGASGDDRAWESVRATARTGPTRTTRVRSGARPGASARVAPSGNDRLRALTTRDLVTELAKKASALARKEVELAKAEMKADLRSEIRMASGLGVAGLCAIFTVQLLLTAIVFALYESGVLPGWAAALIVAAVVLAIGTAIGLWGWAKRVRKPLDTTRRSLQENVRWAKEQIA